MKDIVTPVPPEEVRSTIKKSLENAALDNYTRLSAEAKIEGNLIADAVIIQSQLNHRKLIAEDLRGEMMVPAAKKLEDLIHLAELCVDLLQQNEEHYAEVSSLPCTPTLLTVVLMVSHHSSMLSTLINKLNFFSFFSETNFFLCSRKSSQRFSFHLLFNRDSLYFSHDGAFPSFFLRCKLRILAQGD